MRRPLTLVGVMFLVLVMARAGSTAPVATADPDDSAGALDVAELTHDHSDTEITYTLETVDPDPYAVVGSTPATASWALDFDDDDTADVCVLADLDTAAALTANVLDGDCASATDIADAVVTVATNVYTVVVTRADLDAVAEVSADTDEIYTYRVATESTPSAPDSVPDAPDDDPITHDLAAAQASPTPTPADPPAPSDQATDTAAQDDDTSAGDTSGDGASVGGESAALPLTGDTVDTASSAWPASTGMIVVSLGLLVGSFGAYKLIVRKDP